MERKKTQRNGTKFCGFALMAFLGVFALTSCEQYDLDERMPEWLGSSIYDYLQEEGYDTYVKLIDELGYREVMSKTGSKTLFIADEDAVERFFNSGYFKKADGTPVKNYEDLTLAQKKMLLYGSMLNNVYQVAMLSSSEGPTRGDCMRRISSTSIYDTVPLISYQEMPNTAHWQWYKNNQKSLRCLKDMTLKPMVFFVNKFLTAKKITDDDYDFLFNQGAYGSAPGRQPAEASVNGVAIEVQNIKCFNGFVHKMKDIIYPLPNMAEYLNQNPNTQMYDSLISRFCAPYYSEQATQEFNRLYPLEAVDSVFQMRFFSARSMGDAPLNVTPSNGPINGRLKFDPGWNTYFSSTSSTTRSDVALQQNMGVMLVPNDVALAHWWNEGGGKPLKDRFGLLDSVPDNVIVKLLNNNMLNSFVGSVPSKFMTVLDDANDMMGLMVEDVDSVKMCCNGAIYFTNKVFSPTAYRSVSFPALVNEALSIIYWAIEEYEFDAYLNSMVSTYSFFIPTNDGLLTYIDPVSYGQTTTKIFEFHYDSLATSQANRVYADIYNYDLLTGTKGAVITEKVVGARVQNRLTDILDYHIIIGDVEDGYDFYQTKGRGMIKFNKDAGTLGLGEVAGGFQIEQGTPLSIQRVYDMKSSKGNGKTYIIDQPLLTSEKSAYDILSDSINYPEFSLFFDMFSSSGLFESLHDGQYSVGSEYNISTLNTYHYTLYVPANDSLQSWIDDGKVMTATQIDNEEIRLNALTADHDAFVGEMYRLTGDSNADVAVYIADLRANLTSFVKYHIQDNSVYLGSEFKIDTIHTTSREAHYETAYMNDLNQFEKLAVSSTKTGITVKDKVGNIRKVVTKAVKPTIDDKYHNIMCREYQYNNNAANSATELETSSYLVIHLIDGPLSYGVEQ
ncbi:MAG TPA: hypothetical protein VFC94_00900 [Bacteroidaceae bacterium]|nr:hypothetical protein [Bacteroidaceae bacterium]